MAVQDQENLTVAQGPMCATGAREFGADEIAAVCLGMYRGIDMGHERPIQDSQTETDRVGDRADVVDTFETVEIGGEDGCPGAVTGVDHRVFLDQVDEDGVCTAVGKRSAKDEHVAASHPDDVGTMQYPDGTWLPKVGLGDVEAERAEFGVLSFGSCAADITWDRVECVSHQRQPSTRASELKQPTRMIAYSE